MCFTAQRINSKIQLAQPQLAELFV